MITLAIIGVVAALTLPNVITKFQKQQTVTQLKKVYSIFNQAYERAEQDYGSSEYWEWEQLNAVGEPIASKYIMPYLKGVTKVQIRWEERWVSLDGTYSSAGSGQNSAPRYALPDGTTFRFTGLNFATNPINKVKTHLRININLNGERGPNRYGRDIFVLSIFPFDKRAKGKVVPGTNDQCGSGGIHYNLTREQLTTRGCATCKSDHTGTGYGCAALIMKDGWQIKEDYPW